MTDLVITFILNAVWQTTVLAAVAIAIGQFLRARIRFAVLAIALVGSVIAAALSLVPRSAPATFTIGLPQTERTPVIAIVYFVGLTVAGLRLSMRYIRARRLLSHSRAHTTGIRIADNIASPLTIGRSIVLPASLMDANDASLIEAALEHESAHAERRDYAVHLALEVIALPLFFHPAALLLRRAIAHARELACDERAADRCGARAYANALVRIATLAAPPPRSLALTMATTSIEQRVHALLEPRRRTLPAWVGAAIVFTIAIACARSGIAASTLSGNWVLDCRASDFRQMVPRRFDSFTQTITHTNQGISVQQRRVAAGRTVNVQWSVITDGRTHPLPDEKNAVGTASWDAGRLRLTMQGPGAHRETVIASVRGDRLICDGKTERGTYHAEFVRKN